MILRRLIAGALVVLGVALMLLAPDTWGGRLLLGAGIAVELVGLMLEKKEPRP